MILTFDQDETVLVPQKGNDLQPVGQVGHHDQGRVEQEHRPDAGPDVVLIVNDQDPGHVNTSPAGLNSARIRNQPSSLSILRCPLEDSTRSRIPISPSPPPGWDACPGRATRFSTVTQIRPFSSCNATFATPSPCR